MAIILVERFVNRAGIAWVRTHATDNELFALCSRELHPEIKDVEEGSGQVTCPDCVEIVRRCHEVDQSDLAPEYDNELLAKKWDR